MKCRVCLTEKDISEFYRAQDKKSGKWYIRKECKQCTKNRVRKHTQVNHDHICSQRREKWTRRADEINAARRRDRSERPEYYRLLARSWRQNHIDSVRVIERERARGKNRERVITGYYLQYYHKNHDRLCAYAREYSKKHPKKIQLWTRSSRQHAITEDCQLTLDEVNRIKKSCFFCGSKVDLTLAHDIPLIKGGPWSRGNIFCLCRSCNSRMGTKSLAEVLKQYHLPLEDM